MTTIASQHDLCLSKSWQDFSRSFLVLASIIFLYALLSLYFFHDFTLFLYVMLFFQEFYSVCIYGKINLLTFLLLMLLFLVAQDWAFVVIQMSPKFIWRKMATSRLSLYDLNLYVIFVFFLCIRVLLSMSGLLNCNPRHADESWYWTVTTHPV